MRLQKHWSRLARTCVSAAVAAAALLVFVQCTPAEDRVELLFKNPDGSSVPPISAEISASEAKRNLGLMYRKSMDPNEGMLFIFSDEAPRSFWMKNTYLELDIIFINAAYEVVSIVERATPLTETPRLSNAPAKYVVELLGGSAAKFGIIKGSKIDFSRNL